MLKRILLAIGLIVVLTMAVAPSSAESLCADAGASNPARRYITLRSEVATPTVCVPIP